MAPRSTEDYTQLTYMRREYQSRVDQIEKQVATQRQNQLRQNQRDTKHAVTLWTRQQKEKSASFMRDVAEYTIGQLCEWFMREEESVMKKIMANAKEFKTKQEQKSNLDHLGDDAYKLILLITEAVQNLAPEVLHQDFEEQRREIHNRYQLDIQPRIEQVTEQRQREITAGLSYDLSTIQLGHVAKELERLVTEQLRLSFGRLYMLPAEGLREEIKRIKNKEMAAQKRTYLSNMARGFNQKNSEIDAECKELRQQLVDQVNVLDYDP